MLGAAAAATTSQQHLVDAATAAQWAATRNAAAAAAAAAALMGSNNMVKTNAALGLKTPRLIGNMALNLTNSITNPKSNKSAQLREEVTIRNCDSGKIMGVKGRRVAVVEELSKTVISFQKVDPKSKDRVLTITGSTEDSIQFAKKLIEETIRRNVSPNRFQDATTTPTTPPQVSSTTSPSTATTPSQSATTTTTTAAAMFGNPTETDEEDDDDEDEDDAPGISIETGKDGTLKLCCDDPDVLQAAQAALSEYLNRARRSNRMSAEERAEKKERRKSMPLQSTQQKEEPPPPPLKETRRAFTGSTPNLAASLIEGLAIGPKIPASINSSQTAPPPSTQYSREKLLEIREQIEPSEIPATVLKDANPEVIAELQKPSTTPPSTTSTTTATTNGSTSSTSSTPTTTTST
uniref:K Homology domain-containing protein n=1 Tax=Panagrolaimus sp. ES5 TaxID=591445 RepID=A0AC34F084_9BILA